MRTFQDIEYLEHSQKFQTICNPNRFEFQTPKNSSDEEYEEIEENI